MPFTDTPDPAVTLITDAGRLAFARATLGEISFVVDSFAVGRYGYNDANPVKVLPINTADTALTDQIFPTTGTKPILGFERPYPQVLVVNCKLLPTEVNGGNGAALGELGVWAEIIHSVVPAEIGTKFLFSITHLPIITKTFRQANLFRVVITL